MDKYTYSNLIIDPTKEGIESLIGKEVYYHNVPLACLGYANENCHIGTLKEIFKDAFYPFEVKTPGGHTQDCTCIIPKKEEDPEYVPFEDGDEFLEYYISKANNPSKHKLESVGGIWLKRFDTDVYFMVIELWYDGVVINDSKMRTTQESSDRYCTINDTTSWEELFKDYTFLDGTPCGKLMEDKND